MTFCQEESSTLITCSILSGSSDSTSFFTLLSKNGRSTWCSLLMISNCYSSVSWTFSPPATFEIGIENHFSKSSQQLNTFGRRKLSNAHNSARLFCRGVPVRSSRCVDWYCWPSTDANFPLAFFILWPSSMTIYFHSYLFRFSRSLKMKSYVVIHTFHFVVFRSFAISVRFPFDPL